MIDDDLPPGFGDRHPDDPGDETIIGQVRGPWIVRAWVNYHYSAIQVDITGGKEALDGVDTDDRSVTLAGYDWRPLVVEAATEMLSRTGLPVCAGMIYGVNPLVDLETDAGVDDSEHEEIANELGDILARMTDAPD
jgi:hypothetical protein